jgi:glutamate N-acetyltransferase/amino-acid N-acetyltransferase
MKKIDGGVTAAAGFQAAGIHAGLRKNKDKKDLALIVSDKECSAAAVFTRNVVKAAPVLLDMETIKSGKLRAIICNSGNANACAPDGEKNAKRMRTLTARELGYSENEVFVCSTGVIGQRLNIEKIEENMSALKAALGYDRSDDAAGAIMTTDLRKKEFAYSFTASGVECSIGGIAKGSGMIHPNMGTMLCFLTTDCGISAEMLHKALVHCIDRTINRVTVDGDTSTNDTCVIMANGMAGNPMISGEGSGYDEFVSALRLITEDMAKAIARDGEGATKLITCKVSGPGEAEAEALAKSVIGSSLVKAAMFGSDANCGRVLCAMGYSGVEFDPDAVDVSFESKAGRVLVVEKGKGLAFDEDLAGRVLSEEEVVIGISLPGGGGEVTAWGCDLSYDYVKINGDYRS